MLVKTNMWRVIEQCSNCPFKDNGKSIHLDKGRMDEIKADLLAGENFVCHKTLYGLDVNMKLTDESQTPKMCAGAYRFLKKLGKPNQIMQLAQRMGYDEER